MNPLREEVPLKALYKDAFHIGAAVNPRTIESQRSLLAYHFNSLTAENEMKFSSLHPEENLYTFENADIIAAFAREQDMALRGHTLVWHNQTPDWLFENETGGLVERDVLLARLRSHIQTVVGRYKDVIYCWDVVNEVISDEVSGADDFLRPSKWLEIAGEDFIAKAFEFAHEADPQALLFYNDYNESNPHKRERIYRLVRSLLDQGVPIHGVGLQAHWNLVDPSLGDIRSAIERYAELGLQLQLTELDVSVFRFEDRRTDLVQPTQDMLEWQAERYESIFRLLHEYREHISAVTFWGAADDYTWLDHFPVRGRKNWPFLFDESHAPKSAYDRVARIAKSHELPKPHQPLVSHIYTADPSAHVFKDRIYIYPSHDLDHDGPVNDNGDQYKMEDYHVLSMADMNSPVVDHGEVLHVKDVPWASRQMWAPDAAFKNGKYYLFFPARDHDGIFRIGVATASSPEGPFEPEEHYISGSFSIDPAVFID